MSDTLLIPIAFGDLSFKLYFSFKKEKINKVEIEISCSKQSYKIILEKKVQEVDTSLLELSSAVDIKGVAYLDFSKEKIILDGFYFENKVKKGSFWLEILPYQDCLNQGKTYKIAMNPAVGCSDYPVSVATLQFQVGNDTIHPTLNVINGQSEAQGGAQDGADIYLSSVFFKDTTISGIDTFSETNDHHEIDFSGEVGMYHNDKLFIDGKLKCADNNKTLSDFYLEIKQNI